jgi:antirestriction protein
MGQAAETLEPRIYVACLAAYNDGHLHGVWIDIEDDANAVREAIAKMLEASPAPHAEEYAIHDYEGFGEVYVSEYAGIDKVVEIAGFLREHGTLGAGVLEHYGDDLAQAREAMEDRYRGVFKSLAECMEELTDECVVIPESLVNYIDYEAMARDAELNGDFFTVETGYEEVHVFWGH